MWPLCSVHAHSSGSWQQPHLVLPFCSSAKEVVMMLQTPDFFRLIDSRALLCRKRTCGKEGANSWNVFLKKKGHSHAAHAGLQDGYSLPLHDITF